jgi:uncharacterized protein
MARCSGSAAPFSAYARGFALLLALIAAPAAPVFVQPAAALESGAAATLEPLTLVTDPKGAHPVDQVLSVEVMRTEEQREHGLMERSYLPADRGMLFQFDREKPVMMWMKNTLIPLDMIFIARNGTVTHIHENAEPMSLSIISSDGPVFAVLEVNAGYARKIGLKPGDLVKHPLFAR